MVVLSTTGVLFLLPVRASLGAAILVCSVTLPVKSRERLALDRKTFVFHKPVMFMMSKTSSSSY